MFKNFRLLIIVSLCLLFALPNCNSETSGEIDESLKFAPVKKTVGKKQPARASDSWIWQRYYDTEDDIMSQVIGATLNELAQLDPVDDAAWIEELAGNIKQYDDTAVRAVATTLEGKEQLNKRITLIIALGVLSSEVANRYVPGLLDQMKEAGPKSKRYIETFAKIVKGRSEAVSYLKDLMMDSKDDGYRLKVIDAIASVDIDEASTVLSEMALNEPKKATTAIQKMGNIKTDRNAERLVDMLLRPEFSSRKGDLVKALKNQSDYAAEPLVSALRRLRKARRMEMISLIGKVGGPKVAEELGHYYKVYSSSELSNEEKRKILKIVGKVPDVAVDVAEDALNDTDIEIKREAIKMLGKHGGWGALIILRAYEEDAGPLEKEVEQSIKVIEASGN